MRTIAPPSVLGVADLHVSTSIYTNCDIPLMSKLSHWGNGTSPSTHFHGRGAGHF